MNGIRDDVGLTPREYEVLAHIAHGEDSPEIARELVISTETVRTHVRNLCSKLRARTRAQAVFLAMREPAAGEAVQVAESSLAPTGHSPRTGFRHPPGRERQ